MARDSTEDRNAMSFSELIAWAWRETTPVHKNGTNLFIHLFAVPLFVIGNLLVVPGIFFNHWLLLAAPFCVAVSLALQKLGHSLELVPVHPFMGARDFLRRLYAEQFCNFWRFLLSGQWYASFMARDRSA